MRRALPLPPLLPALLLGALLLAGCGGGKRSAPAPTPTPTAAPAPAPTPAPAPAPVTVALRGIAFVPAQITVRVGQRVTWVDQDEVQHDVRSTAGERIASPVLSRGGSFSFTPTRVGTIAYVCTIHPGMAGTIVVTR